MNYPEVELSNEVALSVQTSVTTNESSVQKGQECENKACCCFHDLPAHELRPSHVRYGRKGKTHEEERAKNIGYTSPEDVCQAVENP